MVVPQFHKPVFMFLTRKLFLFVVCWPLLGMLSCSSLSSQTDEERMADSLANTKMQVKTFAKKDTLITVNNAVTYKAILGTWTDGTEVNATYNFKKDSVYDVEQMQEYPYKLWNDSIHIKYPEYTFSGKVSFSHDSLIIESHDGRSRFARFKKP